MKKAKKTTSKKPKSKGGKVNKAEALRKKARADLRKAGMPIPKDLKKGGLKKAMKKAKKATGGKPSGGKKAKKRVARAKSLAKKATKKKVTASVKVSKAKALRKTARAALKKAGKPIPETLKKGGMKKVIKSGKAQGGKKPVIDQSTP